jgi:integrase
MSAAAARKLASAKRARVIPERWVAINTAAPQLAETMLAYLDQITVSQRPNTVHAVEIDLRLFAGFLIEHDPGLAGAVDIERSHVEAFKVWQHAQPDTKGTIKASTFRRRIGMLRMFFLRIIEWDWPDAPSRVPIFFGDVPKRDEPLPRFLDDADYVKFMRALGEESRIHRRLAIELLARTGMRVGELCDLEADAVTLIGDAYWLRIPVGKLHNDRYVPLHPHLVELIAAYRTDTPPHAHGRPLSGQNGVLDRYAVQRWIDMIAKRAGIGHVHPHRLRHTLATQAINRGMSIEAIAALLGHRSLDMTHQYACISNRVVADEYEAVSAKVEALYKPVLP